VEQKLHFVRKTADRFFILDRGRVVAGGGMEKLGSDLVQEYLTV
jgi:urea transport system ATP-binding protein